jgi:AcrR family transcriptional regulator
MSFPSPLRRDLDRARKQRTRERLLDAAAGIFTRDGFHKPRISDIVGAAGLGQGTFYRYFDSKRAVFEALFERLMEQLLAEFTPMSASLPQGLAQYRTASLAVVARLAGVVRANRDLVLVFLHQGRSVGPDFQQGLDATYDRFAALARFYLDHAIEQGFARACRSDLVSQALVGIALRMVELWLSGRLDETELEAITEELVDFAFVGFSQSKGAEHG